MQKLSDFISPSLELEKIYLTKLGEDIWLCNEDRISLMSTYVKQSQVIRTEIVAAVIQLQLKLMKGPDSKLYHTYQLVKSELCDYINQKICLLTSKLEPMDPWFPISSQDSALRKASSHVRDIIASSRIILAHPFPQGLTVLGTDVQAFNEELGGYIDLLPNSKDHPKIQIFQSNFKELENELTQKKYKQALQLTETLQIQLKEITEIYKKNIPETTSEITESLPENSPRTKASSPHWLGRFTTIFRIRK